MIEQRCLFHKLRKVADKARSAFKGKEQQEGKQVFLQQVRAIDDAEQAKERLRACVETWQQRAPESVATLERDFEQTIASDQRPELARHWVRTTSVLERINRQFASQGSPGRQFWRSEGSTGGDLFTGSAFVCSLVQTVLVAGLLFAFPRVAHARPLKKDTLPYFRYLLDNRVDQ